MQQSIASGQGRPIRTRVDYLDTVRGIAAVSVVCSHFVSNYGIPGGGRIFYDTPLRFWWDGYAAVSLFFVLSGFVLSLRHYRSGTSPTLLEFDYPGYAIARVCRIYLPYIIILGFSAAVWRFRANTGTTFLSTSKWLAGYWREIPTIHTIFRQMNFLSVQRSGSGFYELVPQAWTLAIELMLSLILPCAVWLSGRTTWWFVLLIAWVAVAAGLCPFALHFVLGMLTAKLVLRTDRRVLSRHAMVPLWLLAFFLYAFRYFRPAVSWQHHGNADWYLPGIGSALFIVLLNDAVVLKRMLSTPLLRHLGRVSFSVYLNHFIILLVLTPRLVRLIGAHVPVSLTWLAALSFTVGCSWLLAAVMYPLLEVPSIEIGKWASARLSAFAKITHRKSIA